jgi:transcriptional regulator GlxA family with amidase domain
MSNWFAAQSVALTHPAMPSRVDKTWQYRRLVKQVTGLARTRIDVAIHIAELCRLTSVSQRTLRNAFQVVHGATPYRYLRTVRMTEARKALLSAESESATVTEIATRFGFFELGRFAVEYRRVFSESPSATLRRAAAAKQEITHSPIAFSRRERPAERSWSPS